MSYCQHQRCNNVFFLSKSHFTNCVILPYKSNALTRQWYESSLAWLLLAFDKRLERHFWYADRTINWTTFWQIIACSGNGGNGILVVTPLTFYQGSQQVFWDMEARISSYYRYSERIKFLLICVRKARFSDIAWNNGYTTDGVFMDLSKAFDYLPHGLLIAECDAYA